MRLIIPALLLFILAHTDGLSCSCNKVKIKDAFRGADLIFTGKVINVEPLSSMDTVGVSDKGDTLIVEYSGINFTFEIQNLIKGKEQRQTITVVTTGGGADCGNYFELGTEHLVYSYISTDKLDMSLRHHKTNPFFTTSLCTRTHELNKKSSKEIRRLSRMTKRSR